MTVASAIWRERSFLTYRAEDFLRSEIREKSNCNTVTNNSGDMLYSPIQEVPATPVLRSRAQIQSHDAGTPISSTSHQNDFAVVPDNFVVVQDDFLNQSQDLSAHVPRTPTTSDQQIHQGLPTNCLARRSLSRDELHYDDNSSFTPRMLPNSPVGLRRSQEQIVPRTPVGGFIHPVNTPRSGLSTPDVRTTGERLATTPTSRSQLRRKKYIRTSSLCFGSSSRTAKPFNDQRRENNVVHLTDHIVDATGDNRKTTKNHDSSTKEHGNVTDNAPNSSEVRNEDDRLLNSNSSTMRGPDDIKDFLDMI